MVLWNGKGKDWQKKDHRRNQNQNRNTNQTFNVPHMRATCMAKRIAFGKVLDKRKEKKIRTHFYLMFHPYFVFAHEIPLDLSVSQSISLPNLCTFYCITCHAPNTLNDATKSTRLCIL